MARKLFCSLFVMAVAITFVAADEYTGVITKIDGNNITFQKMKGKGKKAEKDGDPITLTVNSDTKYVGGKYDKDAKKFVEGDPIKDGIKNEMFTTKFDAEKGVRATVTTAENSKTATKIMVGGGGKKKGN